MRKYNEEELNDKRQRERIENAKKVAIKSQEILDSNYERISSKLSRIVKKINSRLDFFLTNQTLAKIVALVLAIILYVGITFSGDINVSNQNNVGKNIYGIKVEALYDKNKYQIENLPSTVDLSLIGTLDQIRKTEIANKTMVIADLTAYKPGLHQKVDLLYSGVAKDVDVKYSQPSYEVDIYEKQEKEYKVLPQLVKSNDNYEYNLKLSQDVIKIRAAQHTLDSIVNVYILVDVSDHEHDFIQNGKIIAFDSDGNLINNLTLDQGLIKIDVKINKIK
jgi:YbbR domain-containing protein